MKFDKIKTEEGGAYLAFSVGECEKVNPIQLYEKYFIKSRHLVLKELLLAEMQLRSMEIDPWTVDKVVLRNAIKFWFDKKTEILSTPIPESFKSLLSTNKKSDQVKLLKGLSFTPGELIACIFYAYNELGFLLSQYEGEHDPIGTETEKKPTLIHLDKGTVKKVGETELSDGQLKQIVEQRKRTVAKLIEKDDSWHCFFITYASIRGDESWKDGQPHFHYISDKFGISKTELIKQIKSRTYQLGNLPHIPLNGYGEKG